MRKGQVEFIVILGIVFIISIAAYYAFQAGVFNPSLVPASVRNQQEIVGNMIKDVARRGADETLRVMEAHGGYLTIGILENSSYEEVEGVIFLGGEVPYWQRCGNDLSPDRSDVTGWLELGVRVYMENHINEVGDLLGKNVTMDISGLSVSANILSSPHDRIDVSVYLPTTVQGYPIEQPYGLSVPTKFGQILDFAKDYSVEASKEPEAGGRFMETFTIASLYFSRYLPTLGILTQCGETISLTPDEMIQEIEDVVSYTITHVLWWQGMPNAPSETKTYAIVSVNGRAYRDLEIGFFLPDRFGLESNDHVLMVNGDIVLSADSPFKVPVCMDTYEQGYSFDYSAVLRVHDYLTGYSFNFATEVFVDDMEPGDCGDVGGTGAGACGDLLCSANVKVVDWLGSGLEGARVFFGDCLVGYTGPDGMVEGKIDCSVQNLSVYYDPSEYSFCNELRGANSVNGTYVLHRKPELTMNLHTVDIDSRQVWLYKYHVCSVSDTDNYLLGRFKTGHEEYAITNIDPDSVPPGCGQGLDCEGCFNNGGPQSCEACAQECMSGVMNPLTVDYIPAGSYIMDIELLDQFALSVKGGSISTEGVPESDSVWHIYTPSKGGTTTLSESGKEELATDLRDICGMEPVESVEMPGKIIYMDGGCSCGDLRNVLEAEISGCPGYGAIMANFCAGPPGGTYPPGCGTCTGDNCGVLCDRESAISLAESMCNTRIRGCP